MNDYSHIDEITLSFFRTNADKEILANEQYEFKSIDNKSTGKYLEKTSDGRYRFDEVIHDGNGNEWIANLVPDVVINELEGIDSYDDFASLNLQGAFTVNDVGSGDYRSIQISGVIPIKLVATKVEDGYFGNEIIVSAHFHAIYPVDSQNNILSKKIMIGIDHFEGGYLYDKEITVNSLADIANLTYDEFHERTERSCMDTKDGKVVTDLNSCTVSEPIGDGDYRVVPYFIAEKKEVKLEITNTVNGVDEYNISNEQSLKYKIEIKNTGNITSTNNVITTYVPKQVKVIESSISNNGVYNAEENTITWDVDGIVAGAVLYLSYDAEAPVDLDGTDLIGYSSIVSNEVASAVVSENTIVSAKEIVDSSNPNTSYLLPKSIFFFEIVFFIVLLVLLKMKVKKTL